MKIADVTINMERTPDVERSMTERDRIRLTSMVACAG
jgi:hypothetical protein